MQPSSQSPRNQSFSPTDAEGELTLFGDRPRPGPHVPLQPCTHCGTVTLRRSDDAEHVPECYQCSLRIGARPDDRPTARAAGESVRKGSRSPLAQAIYNELRQRGSAGATDDELWQAFPGQLLGSVSKRRGELTEWGLVMDSGRTRATRRGRQAVVWVVGPNPTERAA